MQLYQVRVDIYEAATPGYPIVTHLFNGATPEEAHGVHEAHRGADEFLRECEDRSCFRRGVVCHAEVSEGWVDG